MIIIFGAIPATYLGWFAFLGVYIFLREFLTGSLEALIFVLWGLFGLAGTLALWVVALHRYTMYVSIGLTLGLFASIPAALIVGIGATELFSAAILATLTAVVLLVEGKLKSTCADGTDSKKIQQTSSRQPNS